MNGITEGDMVIGLFSDLGGWYLQNGVAEYVGSTHARVRRKGDLGTSYELPSWNWLHAVLDTPGNRYALATFVAERADQTNTNPRDGAKVIQAISRVR